LRPRNESIVQPASGVAHEHANRSGAKAGDCWRCLQSRALIAVQFGNGLDGFDDLGYARSVLAAREDGQVRYQCRVGCIELPAEFRVSASASRARQRAARSSVMQVQSAFRLSGCKSISSPECWPILAVSGPLEGIRQSAQAHEYASASSSGPNRLAGRRVRQHRRNF
jgi:hypothetical protein